MDRDQDGMVTPTELQFMLRNLGIELSDELIDGLMKEASKEGEFCQEKVLKWKRLLAEEFHPIYLVPTSNGVLRVILGIKGLKMS